MSKHSFSPSQTPLSKDYAHYDGIVGDLKRRLRSSHIVIVVLFSFLILSVLWALYLSIVNTVPYVVQVDKQTGHVVSIGAVKQAYHPREAEKMYFMKKFITNTRTLPIDPVVYRTNWEVASFFLTERASQKLNTIMGAEGQKEAFGKATITPTITSIQPLADTENTYQIRWIEEVFPITGAGKATLHFSGTFKMVQKEPKSDKELTENPLGIYIDDFSFTKENEIIEGNQKPVKLNDKVNPAQNSGI